MRPLYERCLESYPSLQPESRARQLWGAGSARDITGDIEAAIPLLRELIELEHARGNEHGLALAQWQYCSHNQAESVPVLRAMLTEATSTLLRLGDRWVASFALGVLAVLALIEGEHSTAERLGQEALTHARAIDTDSAIGVAQTELAYCVLARGDIGQARARFADSAKAYHRVQDRAGLTYALEGLAAVALGQSNPELAARAIGVVDTTREHLGVGVYPIVQRIFRGPFVSAVQPALGSDQFETSRAASAETDLDTAIEELLKLTA